VQGPHVTGDAAIPAPYDPLASLALLVPCVVCGSRVEGMALCTVCQQIREWSTTNRAACNYLHRAQRIKDAAARLTTGGIYGQA
jgi:hypothetical protein